MSLALARAYTASKSPKQHNGHSVYSKIKASDKWVEYSLDLIELTKTLQNVTLTDRFTVAQAIKVAERKRDYMYKHPNFNLNEAVNNLKRARSLLKL